MWGTGLELAMVPATGMCEHLLVPAQVTTHLVDVDLDI